MGVMVCGPAKGESKRYRCIACGLESDDPEDFAVSICWGCMSAPEPEAASDQPQD